MIRNIFTLSLLSLSLFSYNSYADIAIPEQPGLNLPINRNPDPEPQQQQPANNAPQQQGDQQQAQTPSSFKEGTDYILIKPAVPPENSNTIQVINFFSYNCKPCYQVNQTLQNWAMDMPYYVKLINSPVAANVQTAYPVRIYFSLEKIGATNLNTALLKASSEGDLNLQDYKEYPKLKNWLINRQINIKDFETAFDSGEVIAKVITSPTIVKQYNIDTIPALSIDGKYLVPPSVLLEPTKAKQVLNYLVNKASQEKMKARQNGDL